MMHNSYLKQLVIFYILKIFGESLSLSIKFIHVIAKFY